MNYQKILLKENLEPDSSIHPTSLKYEMEMPSVQLYPETQLIHKKVFMACEKYPGSKRSSL